MYCSRLCRSCRATGRRSRSFDQINRTDQQFSLLHLGFEHQSQFPTRVPVVNRLNDRRQLGGQFVEDHRLGVIAEIPPLPVAVRVRREFGQCRMLRIAEQSQRLHLLGRKPQAIPEDRLERAERVAINRREQGAAAGLCRRPSVALLPARPARASRAHPEPAGCPIAADTPTPASRWRTACRESTR